MSSFEVDILDEPELGRGSFGIVKKAMWGKTLVAVKMAVKGMLASEKVRPSYFMPHHLFNLISDVDT